MKNKPIYVTQPFMPPLEEYVQYLEKIWANKWLTNEGEFHKELEKSLCEYLGVEYISLFANGTLALVTALQALRITGEVITTPYSFVATSHALHWNGITPVFCDIDPNYFNLDPKKIEAAITPRTTAILPVHVYGNPCAIEEIQRVADIYGLKVIYDAAHSFGVKVNNQSILNYGDLSILSFHATKVLTTFEGGAIISKSAAMKKRIDYLKNFGFADELTVVGHGINGKMNEVEAAMGLLQLKYFDSNTRKRKIIADFYREKLKNTPGFKCLNDIPGVRHNYSYFPVLIDKKKFGMDRDDVYSLLKSGNIFVRKYFYPLISNFSAYNGLSSASATNLLVAEKISKNVLCLPIYPDLDTLDFDRIISVLLKEKYRN